jgi:transmembrane sensor
MKLGQSNNTSDPTDDSSIALAAIEWLVRLLDTDFDPEEPYPDPLQRQQAFTAWLNHNPAHVRAFLEILEVERRAGHPDVQRLIRIEELIPPMQTVFHPPEPLLGIDGSHFAPGSDARVPGHRAAPQRLRPRSIAATAIAVALAAAVTGVIWFPRPVTATSVFYSTAVGERQMVSLDDGSTVILNAGTRLAVTYDRHTREVRLHTGEAFFDVHHDASRPFRVLADDVFLEDLGTQFDVDRRAGSTQVTVAQGSIHLACGCISPDIAPSTLNVSTPASGVPAHPAAALTLATGDQVNIAHAGGILSRRSLSPDELMRSTSWRDGELWFNGEALSTVVEKLNQYSTRRIVIDPSVANVRIDGMCKTSQVEDCARAVGQAAGVVVVASSPDDPSTIRLARKPPGRS